jgi:hypothetical protein
LVGASLGLALSLTALLSSTLAACLVAAERLRCQTLVELGA